MARPQESALKGNGTWAAKHWLPLRPIYFEFLGASLTDSAPVTGAKITNREYLSDSHVLAHLNSIYWAEFCDHQMKLVVKRRDATRDK